MGTFSNEADKTLLPSTDSRVVSERKLKANQANAKKSTGPKTARGKIQSRRNSLKHGIFALDPLTLQFLEEDGREYYELLSQLKKHYQPVGLAEEIEVQEIHRCLWKRKRLWHYENVVDRLGARNIGRPEIKLNSSALPPKAPSLLSNQLQHQLNCYVRAATGAGVALVALSSPADAKIVYTRTWQWIFSNFDLDLNHDGIPDFVLQQMNSSDQSTIWERVRVYSAPQGNLLVVNSQGANPVVAGKKIGPKRTFGGPWVRID